MRYKFQINKKLIYIGVILMMLIVIVMSSDILNAASNDNKVTHANFELANEWTVEKQLYRTSDLWTIPAWVSGKDRFVYRYSGSDGFSYYLVDPKSQSKTDLFSNTKFLSQIQSESGTDISWQSLFLEGLTLINDDTVNFSFRGATFVYSLESDKLIKQEPEIQDDSDEIKYYSPDGKSYVVKRECNLYLVQNDKSPVQVTFDGEEFNCDYVITWSPDSEQFQMLREDWRDVEDLWLVNPLSQPRQTLETFKWPLPGENIEQHSLWVYNCKENKLSEIHADHWIDQTLGQAEWSTDSKKIYFTRMSRDWMSMDLCSADPKSGECKVLIKERDHRQLIYRPPYFILDDSGYILWWSMKDGWGHYYIYHEASDMLSPVTQGNYTASEVVHIDKETQTLFFMGCGHEKDQNPYYYHLYSVRLDGSGLKCLTPEEAEHKIYMSESGKYFVDNYSCPNLEPQTVVRGNQGDLIMELESADITALKEAGWQNPDVFTAKAADGVTDMWGVMYKPFDFDPAKKYPVIVYGYPGKESEFIPWKFYGNSWITLVSVSMAQYGFVVCIYGNRGGTPERSYEYYNFGWDDLRDYPIYDKKAVIEQLAARHEFIDIDRVGVMGSSSGGFMAATAILKYPDFFKVAVAKSGDQDNNMYYHHWNERYGVVEEIIDENGKTKFISKSPTNNEIAGNLKGHLLLVHGDMDKYVPPSLTSRLAFDLIKAGKRFDLFMIPGGDHFFGENWQYMIKYIELYFVEHLMGDDSWSVDFFGN